MNMMPDNQLMWALIGIYTGREDSIFRERSHDGIKSETANCLFEGDVAALPKTAIHSVTNPLERMTGGIHIHGGGFFATTRSQWNPETLAEEPSDGDVIRGIFERANERMQRCEDSEGPKDGSRWIPAWRREQPLDENNAKLAKRSRSLYLMAMVNTVIWALSVVALVFVIRRAPAAKGLLVILAGGTGVSILLLSALAKLDRSDSA